MPHLVPKQKFQKSPFSKAHADLVVSEGFQTAVEAALIQYELHQGIAPDMGTAAANHWRMVGAREFVSVLLNLSEPATEPPRKPQQNLKHDI